MFIEHYNVMTESPPENTMKWNDLSMTSVSSSYFKPTTQSRSISSLESEPPALQHLLGKSYPQNNFTHFN